MLRILYSKMQSIWLTALLISLVAPGFLKGFESSAGVYLLQFQAECQYGNDGQDVVLLAKWYYNGVEIVEFDSRVGIFVAKTDLGKPTAESWNNDTAILAQARAAVDTVCRHNYDNIFNKAAVQRKVVPEVTITHTRHGHAVHSTLLVCFVTGFYPPEMEISWLRNGEEVTHDISSTGIIQNGDWTYQVLLTLEMTPKAGEKYSCKVDHSSLSQPMIVEWKPEESPSAKNKLITGIGGFVLGAIFIVVGVVIYLKNKKGQTRLPVPQSEGLMS